MPLVPLLLKLLLAHVIADLLPAPARMRAHRHPVVAEIGWHSGLFAVMAAMLLGRGADARTLPGLLAMVAVRAALAALRLSVAGIMRRPSRSALLRGIELAAVSAGACWMAAESPFDLGLWIWGLVDSTRVLLYVLVYTVVVFVGGHLVALVAIRFGRELPPAAKPGLPKAGRYIGWVERFLIMTFLVSGHGEAVGWLLAAKTVARYPEMAIDKEGRFAEYYIVGTLTSVGLALLGGLILVVSMPRL